MSFRYDIANLYSHIKENVSGGGAQPLLSPPPATQQQQPLSSPKAVHHPVPANWQQEQAPVKPEYVTFDFVNDHRRATFFAHLVYNAIHKVAKNFDLVSSFIDELGRIHRKERRNHHFKQLAKFGK
jgi:hypothetical protein